MRRLYILLFSLFIFSGGRSFAQGGLELNVDFNGCDVNNLSYSYDFCATAPSFDITCVYDTGDLDYSSDGGSGTISPGQCNTVTITYTNLTDFYNHVFNYAWSSDWTCTNGQTRSASGSGSYGACSPPSPLSGNAGQETDATCGQNNGSFCAYGSGGTGNYTYSPSQCLNNLSPGNYSITIDDGLSTVVVNVTINDIAGPSAYINSSVNVTCNGLNNGTATAWQNGGTPNYTYLWSPSGQTTFNATGLVPSTTYTVLVTDAIGCTSTATTSVTEPSPLSASASLTKGCTNYTGNSIVAGGTPLYTYAWYDNIGIFLGAGATQPNITYGLTGPITYSLVVTDSKGCTASDTAIYPGIYAPLGATWYNIDANCGMTNGSAISYPTNGIKPYTFLWSTGSTDSILTPVAPGVYTYTVTDAEGCTNTATATVGEKMGPIMAGVFKSDVKCYGDSTGSATVGAVALSPVTYSWSPGGYTASTITNLPAGVYTVTVTDQGGCTDSEIITITQSPSLLVPTALADNNVVCNAQTNGQATASGAGGTAPYTYTWLGTGQATATATGLSAITYTVRVTDAPGCSKTTTITITQPAVISISTVSSTPANCGLADGAATVAASGGVGPYSYSWSPIIDNDSIAIGLAAGPYTVTVTDNNACTKQYSVAIGNTNGPVASVLSSGINPVLCYGNNTGSATVSATGGTQPYTYSWNNGQTDATATGLVAGLYDITVTDAGGCVDVITAVNITQPTAPLSLTDSINHVTCYGNNSASVYVSVAGGTPNYSYSWSNNTSQSSVSNLLAGNYSVIVTDNNMCADTLDITINQPSAALDVSVVSTNVICNGQNNGTVSIDTTIGGTTPYTYSWSNGQTGTSIINLPAASYTVIVTDNNLCTDTTVAAITQPAPMDPAFTIVNAIRCYGDTGSLSVSVLAGGTPTYTYSWSNNGTDQTITGLTSGTYSVLITDANGCTLNSSTTINQPQQIILTASTVDSVWCNGSDTSVTVNVTGGTPIISYLWSNNQTNATATGLIAGTYSLVVTDANSCKDSLSITIAEPTILVASVTAHTDVKCNGGNDGAVTANVTGGTQTYTYSWSNGSNALSLSNLVSGTYTLNATDKYGCSDTAVVSIQQPALGLTIDTLSTVSVNCFGDLTGAATVQSTNGTGLVSYTWSNGLSGAVVTGLAAGVYTVTATDANTCTANKTIAINGPSQPLQLTLTTNGIACFGGTAQVTSLASGGTPFYQYSWSVLGNTNATVSGLLQGTYSIIVTDSKMCTLDSTITITQPASALALIITSIDSVECNGSSTGVVVMNYSGGTPGYSYSWSNGSTNANLSNVSGGVYSVLVTDANGCKDSVTATIGQNSAMNVVISPNDVICYGSSTGMAGAIVTGGIPAYTYSWSNGTIGDSIYDVPAGSYTLLVTDSKGCTVLKPFTINSIGTQIIASFDQSISFGEGPLEVNFTNTSSGASNYLWNLGDSTNTSGPGDPQHVYSLPGQYTVTLIVMDNNGCSDTATSSVYVYTIANVFTPNGDGINDIFWFPNVGLEIAVEIYDRWGLKMFEAQGSQIGWDGRTLAGNPAPDATYYFLLTINHPEGKQEPVIYKGFLQLIR